MTATTIIVILALAWVAVTCVLAIRALAQAFKDADEWQREDMP